MSFKKSCTFKSAVFIPAACALLALVAFCAALPDVASAAFSAAKGAVFKNFSWFYVLAASAFVVFMSLLALSRYGDIRLGRQDEAPKLPFASWLAMLFATGMGVGLMYFGVAEPLAHKAQLATNAQTAMLHTLFHWGIHPWAIYGVVGLAMAYFGFRYGMPLSLRSAFYPLLKERIHSAPGHIVDILALIVTVFGITTTLGYAAEQLGAGLIKLDFLSDLDFFSKSVIIIIIISIATMSAISGATKGLRRLSELNLIVALGLLIYVLFCSQPVQILASLSANIGHYLRELSSLSFETFIYQPERLEWFSDWTIFYWAWWLSWAPFVGFFIAKISRGRTVREFIFGVLIVPTSFNILWFSVFGGAALAIDAAHFGALSALASSPERLLFEFFGYLPFGKIAAFVALLVLVLFFITSADSGIFVLNCLASAGADGAPRWQSIMWGALLAALAAALLAAGGLGSILALTMIVALPFALMLVLMCASLLRGLRADERYFSQLVSPASVYLSGEHWQERLEAMIARAEKKDIESFMNNRVRKAMVKLATRLQEAGFSAYVRDIKGERRIVKLVVQKELAKDFIYGVEALRRSEVAALADDALLPFSDAEFYEPRTFFGDGRTGYDISYLSEREIIVDILKHYERYLSLISQPQTDILTNEIKEN